MPGLLELLANEDWLGPFAVPIGLDPSGRPVWHDLRSTTARHLLVRAPAPDRFELIRTVAVGLSLTTRPALLQFLTIDSTGCELLILENLPHAIAETSIGPAAAGLSLRWLIAELETREGEGRTWPGILLVIDDLADLSVQESRGALRWVDRILRRGGTVGIHVLAGASQRGGLSWRSAWRRPDAAHAGGMAAPGEVDYRRGTSRVRTRMARLSAVDLDLVARGQGRRLVISMARGAARWSQPRSSSPRLFQGGTG